MAMPELVPSRVAPASMNASACSVVRMPPDDLIALLRIAHGAAGCSVVAPPETPEVAGDPRHLFWPPWKSVAGFLVLLGAGILLAIWSLEQAPPKKPQTIGSESAPQAEEEDKPDHRAEAMVGKRVFLGAGEGVKLYGKVTKTNPAPGPIDYREPPRATLTIEIDTLKDVLFEVMPPDTKVPFGPEGEMVGVGSEIEVGFDEATEVPAAEDD